MKKYALLTFLFLVSACASSLREADFRCPRVSIPGEKAYLTQIVNYADNFRIELTGYEGYCYVEDGTRRRYAVITPQFKITRLRDNGETRVDFRYFTDIEQGPPEFVGKKSHFAFGQIDTGAKTAFMSGRPVKVKVPFDNDDLVITLGLDVSAVELGYNQSTFAPQDNSGLKRVQTPCGIVETAEDSAEPVVSGCSRCSVRR